VGRLAEGRPPPHSLLLQANPNWRSLSLSVGVVFREVFPFRVFFGCESRTFVALWPFRPQGTTGRKARYLDRLYLFPTFHFAVPIVASNLSPLLRNVGLFVDHLVSHPPFPFLQSEFAEGTLGLVSYPAGSLGRLFSLGMRLLLPSLHLHFFLATADAGRPWHLIKYLLSPSSLGWWNGP